jgi:hypothetical protein
MTDQQDQVRVVAEVVEIRQAEITEGEVAEVVQGHRADLYLSSPKYGLELSLSGRSVEMVAMEALAVLDPLEGKDLPEVGEEEVAEDQGVQLLLFITLRRGLEVMFSPVGRPEVREVAEDRDRQTVVQERLVELVQATKFNQTFYIKNMEKRIEKIEADIKEIKDNHLSHIQEDMAIVKTNQQWLMKFFWVVATASVAGLITGIINLMIK